jgi:hypothetical protein
MQTKYSIIEIKQAEYSFNSVLVKIGVFRNQYLVAYHKGRARIKAEIKSVLWHDFY